MKPTRTIPEILGFRPVPHDRALPYSRASYQAQYLLDEHEAEEMLARHGHEGHKQIDRELSLRYARDPEYRRRVDDFCTVNGMPEEEEEERSA